MLDEIHEALKDINRFVTFTSSPECIGYNTNDFINIAWIPVIKRGLKVLKLIRDGEVYLTDSDTFEHIPYSEIDEA